MGSLNGLPDPSTAPQFDIDNLPEVTRPVLPKPVVCFNPDGIPAVLIKKTQWVLWKYELDDDGNPTKILYNPHQPRQKASSTNPETWATFDQALSAYQSGKFDGLGFVFNTDMTGCDFDHIRTSLDDPIPPSVMEELALLNSYTEVSPSGRGLHTIVIGTVSRGRKKGDREMYSSSRFFTMTGVPIPGFETVRENKEALDTLYARWFPPDTPHEKQPVPASSPPMLSDDEILEIAGRADNNLKFNALMRGDTSGHGGDDSRADAALCSILAFYTDDTCQMDRIFRQSKLYREKWERDDYRDRTIEYAISHCTERYSGEKPHKREILETSKDLEPSAPAIGDREKVEAIKAYQKILDEGALWVNQHLKDLPNEVRDRRLFAISCYYLNQTGKTRKNREEIIKSLSERNSRMMLHPLLDEDLFALYDRSVQYTEEIKRYKREMSKIPASASPFHKDAEDILKDPDIDVVDHILDKGFAVCHVGDRQAGFGVLVCIGSTICRTGEGIHPDAMGESGKGKTSVELAILHLLPSECKSVGEVSDLAIFYDDSLEPATVIFQDDAETIPEKVQDTIKIYTSQGKEPHSRKVSDPKNKTVFVLRIPERVCFCLNAADPKFSDQFANRFVTIKVDESEDQDQRVYDAQIRRLQQGQDQYPETNEILVIREMFRILMRERPPVSVIIPDLDKVLWGAHRKKNRRDLPMFADIVMACAALNQDKRRHRTIKDPNTGQDIEVIVASQSDINKATEFWTFISQEQTGRKTPTEVKVHRAIVEMVSSREFEKEMPRGYYWIDYEKLRRHLKMKITTFHDNVFGRKNRQGVHHGGLIDRLPGTLEVRDISVTTYEEREKKTERKKYIIYSGSTDLLALFE